MSSSVTDRLRDGAALRLRQGVALLRRPTGPLPRPSRRSLAFDAVLTLVVALTVIHYAADKAKHLMWHATDGIAPYVRATEAGSVTAAVALALIASAPLALRRRYPLAVLWIVTGAAVLTPHDAQRIVIYSSVIAVYSAVAYSPYRVATLASLPVTVLSVGTLTSDVPAPAVPQDPTKVVIASSQYVTVPTQYVPLLILVPLILATNGLRTWRIRADESEAQMSALEREQAEELRRAAEQERARIARELHDVVTHNVSVMVIQAGAARKVMEVAPDQAREALLAVEASGRGAMSELRHAMGLLTMEATESSDPAGTADLAPQPGLDQLRALVGRVRDSGVPVGLTVTGIPRSVPAGIGLAAYRVVQEALTNLVKHAVGATATVTLEYGDDHLRVEVADTGGRPSTAAATGNGHGLIGLRERLAVYGGTLSTGRRPSGGYRVRALIPLEAP